MRVDWGSAVAQGVSPGITEGWTGLTGEEEDFWEEWTRVPSFAPSSELQHDQVEIGRAHV